MAKNRTFPIAMQNLFNTVSLSDRTNAHNIPVSEVLSSFPLCGYFDNPLFCQRNDEDRLAGGMANHVLNATVSNSPQQYISVAIGPRMDPVIVDGHHRVRNWHANGCPFPKLIVCVHYVKNMTELGLLYSMFDSRNQAKGNGDTLFSVFRGASLEPQLGSPELRTGKTVWGVFKRYFGDVSKGTSEMRNAITEVTVCPEPILDLDRFYMRCPAKAGAHLGSRKALFGVPDALALLQFSKEAKLSGDPLKLKIAKGIITDWAVTIMAKRGDLNCDATPDICDMMAKVTFEMGKNGWHRTSETSVRHITPFIRAELTNLARARLVKLGT